MWIGPLKGPHRALQRVGPLCIVHRAGMVGAQWRRGHQQQDTDYGGARHIRDSIRRRCRPDHKNCIWVKVVLQSAPAQRTGGETDSMLRTKYLRCAVLALSLSALAGGAAVGQSPKPGVKGYEVEWVYRI